MNGDDSYTLQWPGALPAPTVDGDTATYHNVWPNIDLVLTALPDGFSQQFVLRAPPTSTLVLRFPLELRHLHASVADDNSITLTDSSGADVGGADPARMWGAAIDEHSDEPTRSASVDISVVPTDRGPALEERPDMGFLLDPAVSYPVTIDPSPAMTFSADTYVASDFPTASYGSDTLLKTGTYNGGSTKDRSYVRFSGFAGLAGPNGSVVTGATLKLYENWSYSCTAKPVQVWALDDSFTNSSTWNNQPGQTSMYGSITAAKGYSSSCPDGWLNISGGGSNGLTIADLVQKWVDGTVDNRGFRIRAADETDSFQWKKFDSHETSGSNQPALTMTYDQIPSQPTALIPADGATVYGPSQTFNSIYSDPDDADVGRVYYKVYNSSGQLVNLTGTPTSGFAGQGTAIPTGMNTGSSASTWSLPAGDYTMRAYADDGTATSSLTAAQAFHVATLPSSQTLTIPGDSTQETAIVFTQPLSHSFLRSQMTSVDAQEWDLQMTSDDGNQGTVDVADTLGNALTGLQDQYGYAAITDMRVVGYDGMPISLPSGLTPYIQAFDTEMAQSKNIDGELDEPDPSDPNYDPNSYTANALQPRLTTAPWEAVGGTMNAYNYSGRAVMYHLFTMPSGSNFPGGVAYEHDFKLRDTQNTCPVYTRWGSYPGTVHFWASRNSSHIYWSTNMPAAYFDWPTFGDDTCHWRDFTVGSYHADRFKANTSYEITVIAARDTDNQDQFQLESQAIWRHCDYSPWCVGTFNSVPGYNPDYYGAPQLLVGYTKGLAPGCRRWHKGQNSSPC